MCFMRTSSERVWGARCVIRGWGKSDNVDCQSATGICGFGS